MKPIKYFLIFIFFISGHNAIVFADDEEIKPNTKEYQLIKEYREIICAFIDEDTDYKIQTRCFKITKKLFELTESKLFLAVLANHYFEGLGVAKNINKGLKFYEEVANSDFHLAIDAQAMQTWRLSRRRNRVCRAHGRASLRSFEDRKAIVGS